ncbi:hypothetical protein EDEG_03319 [Edhazardia aedis USNM 41457]|uniref:Uncharacterized protein n=1 Tax=Edhazardia aedis (strain USNM 41457) TaxID=1003232 RepID=J9DHY6_EDHAE|nr:hypothetical protein EDEG_03319 [Edhazardia aedis USNM 41457]|eukprot:EJW02235.1 hypothetical protein EDEG_03319 [Edhazardia aedis USNM 41457]
MISRLFILIFYFIFKVNLSQHSNEESNTEQNTGISTLTQSIHRKKTERTSKNVPSIYMCHMDSIFHTFGTQNNEGNVINRKRSLDRYKKAGNTQTETDNTKYDYLKTNPATDCIIDSKVTCQYMKQTQQNDIAFLTIFFNYSYINYLLYFNCLIFENDNDNINSIENIFNESSLDFTIDHK